MIALILTIHTLNLDCNSCTWNINIGSWSEKAC